MINKTSKLATIALAALTAFGCAGNRSQKKTDLYPDARTLHCPSVTTYDPVVGANKMIVNGIELQRVYHAPRMSDGERILTEFYDGDPARARQALESIKSLQTDKPYVELAPRNN